MLNPNNRSINQNKKQKAKKKGLLKSFEKILLVSQKTPANPSWQRQVHVFRTILPLFLQVTAGQSEMKILIKRKEQINIFSIASAKSRFDVVASLR